MAKKKKTRKSTKTSKRKPTASKKTSKRKTSKKKSTKKKDADQETDSKSSQRTRSKQIRAEIESLTKRGRSKPDGGESAKSVDPDSHRRSAPRVRPLSPRAFIHQRMQEMADSDEESENE